MGEAKRHVLPGMTMDRADLEFINTATKCKDLLKKISDFVYALPEPPEEIVFSIFFYLIILSKTMGVEKPHFLSDCSNLWEMIDKYELQDE